MSIHKSQGQSKFASFNLLYSQLITGSPIALERVKVDLGSVFEKGQGRPLHFVVALAASLTLLLIAYVALSRATSMEGLQILGFSKAKVMAHPKVRLNAP